MKKNITLDITREEISALIKSHLEAKGMKVNAVQFRIGADYSAAGLHGAPSNVLEFARCEVEEKT